MPPAQLPRYRVQPLDRPTQVKRDALILLPRLRVSQSNGAQHG